MQYRIPAAILATIFLFGLAACQDNAGPDAPKAAAAAPDTADSYAPDGTDGRAATPSRWPKPAARASST